MSLRSFLRLFPILLLCAAGCGDDDDDDDTTVDPDGDADADSDADSDADGDGDADGDADGDSDGDGDGDADGDSDADGDADGDADIDPAVRALCTNIGDAVCSGWQACCLEGWPKGQLDTCVSAYLTECSRDVGSMVAGGRVQVVPDGGQACVDAVRGALAACEPDQLDQGLTECEAIVVGLTPEGDECDNDVECLPGLACYSPGEGGSRCITPPGEGEHCAGGYLCADGMECGQNDRCVPLADVGEECTLHRPDPKDPNWIEDDCVEGLFCDDDNLCARRLAGGEVCSRDDMCRSYWCNENRCDDDGGEGPPGWCENPFEGFDDDDDDGDPDQGGGGDGGGRG